MSNLFSIANWHSFPTHGHRRRPASRRCLAIVLALVAMIVAVQPSQSIEGLTLQVHRLCESGVPNESDESSDESDPTESTEDSLHGSNVQRTGYRAAARLQSVRKQLESRYSAKSKPGSLGDFARSEMAGRNGFGAPLRC